MFKSTNDGFPKILFNVEIKQVGVQLFSPRQLWEMLATEGTLKPAEISRRASHVKVGLDVLLATRLFDEHVANEALPVAGVAVYDELPTQLAKQRRVRLMASSSSDPPRLDAGRHLVACFQVFIPNVLAGFHFFRAERAEATDQLFVADSLHLAIGDQVACPGSGREEERIPHMDLRFTFHRYLEQ
jgi:hypothetical protein